ncbi:hypothetical protein DACRYDRAFT_15362 [Dacryopinax primogenitus]|uniref:Uncharacterized protein n=1 Tax=Dacryopinax primogenitus (strain DJM 731) TaxID=1858805 RepID=M5G221_DACPD|nr:uncharacterized protein DACRYDRAFT_15362 [Dacryopinax primogenitus]EJU02739.1 hypothetical protein DACRYDRAFT_15362 [Dacryopinax primogenitus]
MPMSYFHQWCAAFATSKLGMQAMHKGAHCLQQQLQVLPQPASPLQAQDLAPVPQDLHPTIVEEPIETQSLKSVDTKMEDQVGDSTDPLLIQEERAGDKERGQAAGSEDHHSPVSVQGYSTINSLLGSLAGTHNLHILSANSPGSTSSMHNEDEQLMDTTEHHSGAGSVTLHSQPGGQPLIGTMHMSTPPPAHPNGLSPDSHSPMADPTSSSVLVGPPPLQATTNCNRLKKQRIATIVMLFSGTQPVGKLWGRGKIKIKQTDEASATGLIHTIFGQTAGAPSHGLSQFQGEKYWDYSVSTSVIPSFYQYGQDTYGRQEGHQYISILGPIISCTTRNDLPIIMHPMRQDTPQTSLFKSHLPPKTRQQWVNGDTYVIYLLSLSTFLPELPNVMPSTPLQSPSPDPPAIKPMVTPLVISALLPAAALAIMPAFLSGQPPVLQAPVVGESTVQPTAFDNNDNATYCNFMLAVAHLDKQEQQPDGDEGDNHVDDSGPVQHQRRPIGMHTHVAELNPHFGHIASYLNEHHSEIHNLLSGTTPADDPVGHTQSLYWFICWMELFMELAMALSMPWILESNMFIVPHAIGWDGHISSDDLVSWFSIHSCGGLASCPSINNNQVRQGKFQRVWDLQKRLPCREEDYHRGDSSRTNQAHSLLVQAKDN